MVSYWRSTLNRSALVSESLPGAADVVVIGGGVVGASALLALTHRGVKALLIEQGAAASGASGANGGLLVTGLADSYSSACRKLGDEAARRIYNLSVEGQRLMREFVANEAIDCDLRVNGNLSLCLGEEQAAASRSNIARLQQDGFAAEWLDRDELATYVQQPLGEAITGARFNPSAATVHSARLVNGLLAAAQRRGARLTFQCQVEQLEEQSGGWFITTTLGAVRASRVIVAVNAWSDYLFPQLRGVITMVRGQVLTTAPVEPLITAGFGVALTETGEYGQQLVDGRILFGGCRALAVDRDVGAPVGPVTPEVQQGLEEGLAHLFPTLRGVTIEQRWSGPMAFTADYLPIIDEMGAGLFFTGGFSGHGMPFAAVVGSTLAEAALTGQLPDSVRDLRMNRPTLHA